MNYCPICRKKQMQGIARSKSCTMTCMYSGNGFTVNGKHHYHNDNKIKENFECQYGHTWIVRRVSKCWCGWQSTLDGPELEVTNEDEKSLPHPKFVNGAN